MRCAVAMHHTAAEPSTDAVMTRSPVASNLAERTMERWPLSVTRSRGCAPETSHTSAVPSAEAVTTIVSSRENSAE